MAKPKIQSVKGTRDFYPEQMLVRNWLYANMRAAAQAFGYQEYDGPFIESLELYAAKSGDELVKEQAFVFQDRGGEMVTLRPELTPSLARMIAARQALLPRPIRWWSFGPFWRYERPQKGRTREFFQWNIDLLGADNPQADAEIAAVGAGFFRAVGLSTDQIRIKVNNRRLMEDQLGRLGIPMEQKTAAFRVIDRRGKLSQADWVAYAAGQGMEAQQLAGLEWVLGDPDLWRSSSELAQFFDALEALGASDYVEYDPAVVRGLDYYTGNVFEAVEATGEGRSIFGGGRYDNLVGDVGGEPLSGVGFALGDVMISVVLEKFGLVPPFRPAPAQVLVTVFDESLLRSALSLSRELRDEGLKVEWYPGPARLPKQLKYADSLGIPYAAIEGPDETARGEVTLKDLSKRRQVTVPRPEAARTLRSWLQSSEERPRAGSEPAGG